MVLRRKIILLCAGVLLGTNIKAQSYSQELLRYSMNDINGTARSIGVGGAFSTVGADMSNAFSNPAGLGLYRGTEISGSLGLLATGNTTSFLGSQAQNLQFKAYAPHVGAIFSVPVRRQGKSSNFMQLGLVYEHLADFNNKRTFSGVNNHNSQIDGLYSEIMSSSYPISYDYYSPQAVQAFDVWMFDSIEGGQYFKAPVVQSGTYVERGGSNEIALTFSGNINDKVYIGGGFGIPWVNYQRDVNYGEAQVNLTDTIYNVQSYNQQSSYSASGVGFNMKFGIIVRPVAWWRIGASLVTPSWFKLREQLSMATQSYSPQNLYAYSDTFISAPYRFSYTRPLKFTLGTSFYLTKWGFLSVDYELNDYGHTKLNFSGYSDISATYNNQMNAYYGVGHTVRAGVEVAPINVLRLRAGYMFNSTPFKSSVSQVSGYNLLQNTATFGVGYRGKVFFTDLAYAYSTYGSYQSIYTVAQNEPAMLAKYHNHRVVLTLGIYFAAKDVKK